MRTRSFLILLLALSLLPVPALAKKGGKKKRGRKAAPEPVEQPAPEVPPSMFEHIETKPFVGTLQVERHRLKSNDLQVLLIPDATSDTLAFHTYFDVGSGDEVVGKTGLAHLFEHMMFKRTDQYDDQHFSKTIEQAGGPDLNAWTWLDITAYHVSLPKDQLPLIVDLEATRMDGLVIDQGQLDAEREVVINERRYRVDNSPEGAMNEKLWALAFEESRYHWPTIGWQADIEGYTVEDLEAFYRDYYAPNNATIVLAGGFESTEALALIEAAYGGIAASKPNRLPHGDEPEQTAARRLDLELQIEAEMLQVGFKALALTDADYPALSVLDSVLTEGMSSRLQRLLVDSGLAASAGAYLPQFQNVGLYEFSAAMRPGQSADAALAVLDRELEDLRTNLVGDEELERARNQLLANAWEGLLSNSGRAGFVGFNEVAAGDWTSGLSRIDGYKAVTAEDVQRVAQAVFVASRQSTVVGRPKGKKLLTFKAKSLPPRPGAGAELPSLGDRPLEGPYPGVSGEVKMRTSLGWTRVLVHDPTVPMIWFRVVVPAGAAEDPIGKEGLANITAELVLRGTADRSRDVFERTLEGLGASVSGVVGSDTITFSGSVLKENWPKLAILLAEALEFPAFDADDLDDLVEEVQADLIELRNNDRGLGRRAFDEGLYGDHPYGRPVLGTSKSLSSITRDDVSTYFRAWFSSQDAVAALLGDFDAGAGGDLVKIVGKLTGTGGERTERAEAAAPQGRRVVLVDKPERTQVQMHLGHFFAQPDSDGYAASWATAEAFGGYGFGTRLMHEIREKRGWSYGAYASPAHRRDSSTWMAWVFPATGDAIPCLNLVLEMYETLVAEGITEDELAYARDSIVNSAAFYVDTPAKRLSYEVRKLLTGYDPLTVVPEVATVDLAAANAAAASAFSPADLFATVVGTADSEVTLGEGDDARTLTLLDALKEIFGADAVEVVAYDAE